jgi:hypothetical protein
MQRLCTESGCRICGQGQDAEIVHRVKMQRLCTELGCRECGQWQDAEITHRGRGRDGGQGHEQRHVAETEAETGSRDCGQITT